MLSRTTTRTVTFLMPFSIAAAERRLPAGAYLVETDEELIQGLSFPAYRRVATFLRIQQAGLPAGWIHCRSIRRNWKRRWRGMS